MDQNSPDTPEDRLLLFQKYKVILQNSILLGILFGFFTVAIISDFHNEEIPMKDFLIASAMFIVLNEIIMRIVMHFLDVKNRNKKPIKVKINEDLDITKIRLLSKINSEYKSKNIVLIMKKNYEDSEFGRATIYRYEIKDYNVKKLGGYYFHVFITINGGSLIFAQNISIFSSDQIRCNKSIFLYGHIFFASDIFEFYDCKNMRGNRIINKFGNTSENKDQLQDWAKSLDIDLGEERFGVRNNVACTFISPYLRYDILDLAKSLEITSDAEEKKSLIIKISKYFLPKDMIFLEGRFGNTEDPEIRVMMKKLRSRSNAIAFNKEIKIYL